MGAHCIAGLLQPAPLDEFNGRPALSHWAFCPDSRSGPLQQDPEQCVALHLNAAMRFVRNAPAQLPDRALVCPSANSVRTGEPTGNLPNLAGPCCYGFVSGVE